MPAAGSPTAGEDEQVAKVRYGIAARNMNRGAPVLALFCFGMNLSSPLQWPRILPWCALMLVVLLGYDLIAPLRMRWMAQDGLDRRRRLLQRMGYRADVAADGTEAMERVQRQRCDLLLMDVQMPGMDVLAATRLIGERLGDDGPRIIAMTAIAMQGDREACTPASMDGCIARPFRVEALAEALQQTPSAEELR
jgi:CheY-like chemotaxis protein